MSPDTESLKDGEEFLVVGVVVEFRGSKGMGMEGHRVDFTRICLDGEDGTKSIVRGISLDDDRFVPNPMCEDQSRSEGTFQGLKGLLCILSEVPSHTLVSKTGERNDNVGVF